MEKYVCCFCDSTIDEKVTALLAVTNWNKVEASQESQQLFCHFDCLKKSIINMKYLYIDEE